MFSIETSRLKDHIKDDKIIYYATKYNAYLYNTLYCTLFIENACNTLYLFSLIFTGNAHARIKVGFRSKLTRMMNRYDKNI